MNVRENFSSKIANHLISQLTKRRFEASYSKDAVTARNEILSMIPDGATIFRCGSETIGQMGIWSALKARQTVTLIDPYNSSFTPEEKVALRVKGLSADFMLASCNALTIDGKLVNLDATGNRVAAICFGPKKVILAVGINKVVPDLKSAIKRVKHYAAPLNAIRLGLKTPCVEDGICHDCKSPARICNMWSVIESHIIKDRIHIKLIGEELGY